MTKTVTELARERGLIALANAGLALREHWVESAGSDMDGGLQQDALLAAGVIAQDPRGYSVERHGEQHEWGPEEGDTWYVETAEAYAARIFLETSTPTIATALLSVQERLERACELLKRVVDQGEERMIDWNDPYDVADFTGWVLTGDVFAAARAFLTEQSQ